MPLRIEIKGEVLEDDDEVARGQFAQQSLRRIDPNREPPVAPRRGDHVDGQLAFASGSVDLFDHFLLGHRQACR